MFYPTPGNGSVASCAMCPAGWCTAKATQRRSKHLLTRSTCQEGANKHEPECHCSCTPACHCTTPQACTAAWQGCRADCNCCKQDGCSRIGAAHRNVAYMPLPHEQAADGAGMPTAGHRPSPPAKSPLPKRVIARRVRIMLRGLHATRIKWDAAPYSSGFCCRPHLRGSSRHVQTLRSVERRTGRRCRCNI